MVNGYQPLSPLTGLLDNLLAQQHRQNEIVRQQGLAGLIEGIQQLGGGIGRGMMVKQEREREDRRTQEARDFATQQERMRLATEGARERRRTGMDVMRFREDKRQFNVSQKNLGEDRARNDLAAMERVAQSYAEAGVPAPEGFAKALDALRQRVLGFGGPQPTAAGPAPAPAPTEKPSIWSDTPSSPAPPQSFRDAAQAERDRTEKIAANTEAKAKLRSVVSEDIAKRLLARTPEGDPKIAAAVGEKLGAIFAEEGEPLIMVAGATSAPRTKEGRLLNQALRMHSRGMPVQQIVAEVMRTAQAEDALKASFDKRMGRAPRPGIPKPAGADLTPADIVAFLDYMDSTLQ